MNRRVYPFVIKKSSIEGNGAFATRVIKKDELICRMTGEEISISELKRRYKNGTERYTDPLQTSESTYVDLEKPFVLINHSCDPNATIITGRRLVALKDIKPGEEITYDYSMTEWSNEKSWRGWEDWTVQCHCAAKNCRGAIEEFRFLPKTMQAKAVRQKRVPNYIVRKYERNVSNMLQ